MTTFSKTLVLGWQDIGAYSRDNVKAIERNVERNRKLAEARGWDVVMMDESNGPNGNGDSFLDSPTAYGTVTFDENAGNRAWAQRSDIARMTMMTRQYLEGDIDGTVMWLDADLFVTRPEVVFRTAMEEGLYASKERWYDQDDMEQGFVTLKRYELTNSLMAFTGLKGFDQFSMMRQVLNFWGTYGDPSTRPFTDFGPLLLTRMEGLNTTYDSYGNSQRDPRRIWRTRDELGEVLCWSKFQESMRQQDDFNLLDEEAFELRRMSGINLSPSTVEIADFYDYLENLYEGSI